MCLMFMLKNSNSVQCHMHNRTYYNKKWNALSAGHVIKIESSSKTRTEFWYNYTIKNMYRI